MAKGFSVAVNIGGRVSSSLGRAVGRTQDQFDQLGRSVQRAQSQNLERRGGYRQQIGDVAALGAAMYGLIRPAVAFEESMARVGAITGSTRDEIGDLTDQARELGRTTQFSASQSAQAMKNLGMAGFQTNEILAATPGLLDLAAAGGTALGRTADIASNVLSGFSLAADEMGRIGDVLSKTFTSSNVTLASLGSTMSEVAGPANAAGSSLEEVAAMAGLLGNVGIQGSKAGTALRATFSRLAAPTGKAADALHRLGVETRTAEGDLRSVPSILAEIGAATEELGSAERQEALKNIFGEEPAAAVERLVAAARSGDLSSYIGDLQKAQGATAKAAERMADTTAGAFRRMASAGESVAISIGSTILPTLADGADGAAALAGKIGALAERFPIATKMVTTATVGLIGLKIATLGAGYAWTFLKGGVLTGAMAMHRTLGVLGKVALGVLNPLGLVRGALIGVRAAAMATGVGAALAGIAAAGTWIYNNWSNLGAMFDGFGRGFMAAVGPVRPVIQGIGDSLGWVWGKLTGILGPVEGAEQGFASFGERVGSAVGGAVAAVAGFVRDVIALPGKIGAAIMDAAQKLGGLVTAVAALPGKVGSMALETGKALVGGIVDGIKGAGSAIGDAISSKLSKAREYLPFSDAKRGPLSDLTASGRAIPTTIGEGIAGAGPRALAKPLAAALSGALAAAPAPAVAALGEIALPTPPAATVAVNDPGAPPAPPPPPPSDVSVEALSPRAQAPAGNRTVNFNPTINLSIEAGADPEVFEERVRRVLDGIVSDLEAERRAALND